MAKNYGGNFMNPPRILLVNVHSTQNAGDLALLECALSQLRQSSPSSHFIICANWIDEAYYKKNQLEVIPSPFWIAGAGEGKPIWLQILRLLSGLLTAWWAFCHLPLPRWSRWKPFVEAYRQADFVVGVAGNQFYSTGRYGWPFPLHALSVYMAHLFRKPFYTMPQSLGPLRRWWERLLMKWLYGRGKKIYLRDQVSIELAKSIGIPPKLLIYAPDPAFAFDEEEEKIACELLEKYGWKPGQLSIGATVLAFMGRTINSCHMHQYYRVIAGVLEKMISNLGVDVYLFIQVSGPTSMENDRNGAQKVLELMPGRLRHRTVLVDEQLSPALLKACYGKMNLFLATRLHSGIFSLGMHVPTVFVGYLTKTRGVLTSLDLADWCVPIDGLTEDDLWAVINQAWNDRYVRRKKLQEIIPGIACEALKVGSDILRDWNKEQE
ncbi:MAG TPA: polysaccharide pyruvyl transferase family protein [Anaerolineaceae bacterium]|jgi:colanic acid/amylovoran biosynthesis protein|nr:polysaccharide pyruvyl transferase family protein [Anaerolineaceae bacterium]HOD44963.1 polysaccharide pyruvyl transferase family protein [Anaerolineaceae bacterium]HOH20987.1 polysaccharide pyruvyl transferase family protein [Anaerolineaceae bacterium]HOU45266.1 polysaccharide pyruvyl transferase family protein [Anaerolineaceae bacterium]HQH36612.1 polysaccharide pyruvyl transferase family protein [Anaerolineaceae bacterium]